MPDRNLAEFRYYYFTSNYDATVAFYRDLLGLEIFREWSRSSTDRGTVFRSPNGVGLIEIELGGDASPARGGLYIEVDDLDAWYQRFLDRGVPVVRELAETSYGHRNFKTADPNGLEVVLFSYLDGSR